jgi:hypothetical protein
MHSLKVNWNSIQMYLRKSVKTKRKTISFSVSKYENKHMTNDYNFSDLYNDSKK